MERMEESSCRRTMKKMRLQVFRWKLLTVRWTSRSIRPRSGLHSANRARLQGSPRPLSCTTQHRNGECCLVGFWATRPLKVASSRYIVELEDGSRKQVKRLALRFNEEDAQNFALRVETCRAKKAHCELQQAFIRFIESQSDELVSSMLRDQKERFIRQGLHGSHLEDAGSFVSQIRDLIREIEENYILSMKFVSWRPSFRSPANLCFRTGKTPE